MAFTFNAARKLSPEEANPMNALISRAMQNFSQGMDLAYKPRQKEANIFAKEIGPLAALASSPNFQGFNPQVQKMIAQHVGGYLGGGNSSEMGNEATTPGYATDEDIYSRLKHGADITQSEGGQLKTKKANIVGEAEKWGLPHAIAEWLGGNKAAGENAAFEQAKSEALQKLKLKGYSESEAKKIINQREGESNKAYSNRLKPLFVSETPQENMRVANASSKTLIEMPDGKKFFIPTKNLEKFREKHKTSRIVNLGQ